MIKNFRSFFILALCQLLFIGLSLSPSRTSVSDGFLHFVSEQKKIESTPLFYHSKISSEQKLIKKSLVVDYVLLKDQFTPHLIFLFNQNISKSSTPLVFYFFESANARAPPQYT